MQTQQINETIVFDKFYTLTYNKVYSYIYRRTLDTFLTEEIISTVYIKLYKNIQSLHTQNDGEIFSWCFKVAYNSMIDHYRSISKLNEVDIDNIGDEELGDNKITNDLYNKSKLEEVLSFMDTLSERDKHILILRIWEEYSYNEISNITGESIDNCKQIVSRSLNKISANISYLFIFSLLLNHVL